MCQPVTNTIVHWLAALALAYRARVSTVARGAWHQQNFWTAMSGTCGFGQFYYIKLCFTVSPFKFEELLVFGTRCFKFPTQALECIYLL